MLAARAASVSEAAKVLGTTGYVVHSVPFAAYCFMRFGLDPLGALTQVVGAGGDTDSTGAIVGAWLGALHGAGGLPARLLERIHDGPSGPAHLRALADCPVARRVVEPLLVAELKVLANGEGIRHAVLMRVRAASFDLPSRASARVR